MKLTSVWALILIAKLSLLDQRYMLARWVFELTVFKFSASYELIIEVSLVRRIIGKGRMLFIIITTVRDQLYFLIYLDGSFSTETSFLWFKWLYLENFVSESSPSKSACVLLIEIMAKWDFIAINRYILKIRVWKILVSIYICRMIISEILCCGYFGNYIAWFF